MSGRSLAKIVVGIVLLLGFFIFNPFATVQSHERGLKFTFGSISNTVLNGGLHWRWPIIQSIKKVSIRPRQEEIQVEVGTDGAITKDNQTIGATLTIFYVYKDGDLVTLWKDYGEEKIKSLIVSSVKESFKNTVGTYTIFELPTEQDNVRAKALGNARTRTAQYPAEITELRITNYDWSDEFDKQIATTMKKAQEVKQKEQELKVTELETQKLVKTAESEKAATVTRAEGARDAARLEAEAKALQGEGIRKFNESIRATRDIEVTLRQLEIEKARVEKWDGQYVPENHYGPIPIQTKGGLQGQ